MWVPRVGNDDVTAGTLCTWRLAVRRGLATIIELATWRVLLVLLGLAETQFLVGSS